MFQVGQFTAPIVDRDILDIRNSATTEDLKLGTVCSSWDHVFEWDEHCLKASSLEQWRQLSDPLCDAALLETFPASRSSIGMDLLESIERQASRKPGPARDFMDHITSLPPEDVQASHAQIFRGQDFFYKYSAPIIASLMHFSLAGGFASPRIARVLHSVSYLLPRKSNESEDRADTQATNDRTFKRLSETLQMILDAMGGHAALTARQESKLSNPSDVHDLVPGQEGWRSIIRVRLLHGVARRRIMERLRHHEVKPGMLSYDFDADGYPINQEDMAATLASFSVAPLWCLSRQGYYPSSSGTEDFLALWRHIGFYLGIDPTILSRHFKSVQIGEKFLCSILVHLLETPTQRKDQKYASSMFPPPTMSILRAICLRPPFPATLAYHCALARFLLGDALADHLEIPRTSWPEYIRLRARLLTTMIPYLFGKLYRIRMWEARRLRLSREGLQRVVRWQMGMRRTAFRPRDEKGELANGVQEIEAVVPNMALAEAFMSEYRLLIREMLGVLTVGVALSAFAIWKGWKLVSA